MKKFMKMFFASLLALIVASFLPFLILVGVISAFTSSSDSTAVVKNESILVVNLSNPIVDEVSSNPMDYFDFNSFDIKAPLTIQKAVHSILAAAKDDRIESIYLNIKSGNVISLTNLEELRRAISIFKESGKKVYSYSSSYSNSSYYLASVANKVVLAPMGSVGLLGLSSEVTYYKDLLDKLGIDIDLIRVGKYKSAGEPFISNKMSSANRQQLSELLNSMWISVVSDISESRGVSILDINEMINSLDSYRAEDALKNKLVDKVQYFDEFVAELEEDEDKYISLKSYASTILSIRSVKEDGKPVLFSMNKVALVNASGTIVNGKSADGTVGDATLCSKLELLRKDTTVKAVVLRINSGGGSATASEYMRRELELLQKVKPLIVSMGSYAASGGYWMAMPADYIFAEKTTLTGSIGVFSMIPNVEKATDKIGLNMYNVSTNKNSGLLGGMIFRGLNKTERAFMQEMTNDIYSSFLETVANGRNLSIERVEELAQGRVWSGVDAKTNGLIDEIGGVVEAIYYAAERAGVQDNFILHEPKDKGDIFSEALKMFSAEIKSLVKPDLGIMQNDIDILTRFSKNQGAMAMMPYMIEIE